MMSRLTERELNSVENVSYCKCFFKDCDGNCQRCELQYEADMKLKHYEDLEEQGLLLKLPKSDWNDLIKQLAIIIENDFIVYYGERGFIANQFFSLEYDEELRFSATCRCFNGTENDWWCDEECEHGEDGKGCYITFRFSDIGKTVFLTKEEAEAKLKELENV